MDEQIENTNAAVSAAGVEFADDIDSGCSTPYVSAPSSPTRGGFYYSAPASPMHFVLASTASLSSRSSASAVAEGNCSFEFDFRGDGAASADELFLNGQIRPMKLSTHLRNPQHLTPLIESDKADDDDQAFTRGRDLKFLSGSLRRRTRSMSPMRTSPGSFRSDEERQDQKMQISTGQLTRKLANNVEEDEGKDSTETTPCASRSSSAGRSSKRWVFLKEFLYRSKSEGRNKDGQNHKFWSSISFSPMKDKKPPPTTNPKLQKDQEANQNPNVKRRAVLKNGSVRKRRGPPPSAHELHYTLNRAQSEEMRKKTFLPYRQGLFGCLGFSSRSYGAMNGFARALNTVYSS